MKRLRITRADMKAPTDKEKASITSELVKTWGLVAGVGKTVKHNGVEYLVIIEDEELKPANTVMSWVNNANKLSKN